MTDPRDSKLPVAVRTDDWAYLGTFPAYRDVICWQTKLLIFFCFKKKSSFDSHQMSGRLFFSLTCQETCSVVDEWASKTIEELWLFTLIGNFPSNWIIQVVPSSVSFMNNILVPVERPEQCQPFVALPRNVLFPPCFPSIFNYLFILPKNVAMTLRPREHKVVLL